MPDIDAKEAALSAKNYLEGVVGRVKNVSIEEIEMGTGTWKITLAYSEEDSLYPFGNGPLQRKYKVFEVKRADGRVVSMKIKTFK
jgi:hypothetical protein